MEYVGNTVSAKLKFVLSSVFYNLYESLRVCILREFYKAFPLWGNLMLSVLSSDKACTVYAHMLTNSFTFCNELSL